MEVYSNRLDRKRAIVSSLLPAVIPSVIIFAIMLPFVGIRDAVTFALYSMLFAEIVILLRELTENRELFMSALSLSAFLVGGIAYIATDSLPVGIISVVSFSLGFAFALFLSSRVLICSEKQ